MDRSESLSLPPSARASAVIRLPAEMGVGAAAALLRELATHVEDPAPVVLDATEVARIHTAALQLFCLFFRDRGADSRETRWKTPSAAMRRAAALLGVTTLLNMAQEAGA